MQHVVAAFAVAPLGGALFAAVVAFSVGVYVGPDILSGEIIASSFIVTAGVGYAAAVFLGIPGFLLFRRFRWIRASHWVLLCASIGAATGAAVPAAGALIGGATDDLWATLGGMLLAGALVGAASGLPFARIIKVAPPAADEIASTFD
jgi:hypothetical protein